MAIDVKQFLAQNANLKIDPSKATAGGFSGTRKSRGNDLNTVEGLKAALKDAGVEVPEPKKPFSALKRFLGVLNTPNAFVAGGVKALVDKDPNTKFYSEPFKAAAKSFKGEELLGFSDVIRSAGYTPESRGGKALVGTLGFVGDVLFDPLTYLTLGVSTGTKALKAGQQVLTKEGSKLLQDVSSQVAQTLGNKAQRETELLFSRATGKRGLTELDARQFIQKGFPEEVVRKLQTEGKNLVDQGGIKFMGKSLVKGDTIRESFLGKAASAIGKTGTAQDIKNVLGKLFVPDFLKNKKVVRAIEKGARSVRESIDDIIKTNTEIFSKVPQDKFDKFVKVIRAKKKEIVPTPTDITKKLTQLGLKATKKNTEKAASIVRAENKARQVSEDISKEFAGDPELVELSNKLFGAKLADGKFKPGILQKFSRIAGLNDDDAIRFYFPDILKDAEKPTPMPFGKGVSAPKLKSLEKFQGLLTEDKIITDPFEAFTRNQIATVTARAKTNVVKSVMRELGRPLSDFTEKEAKRYGYVKYSKNILPTVKDKANKVEGWILKSVKDSLDEFIEPKDDILEEAARTFGFDYVTSLFKGYVTSLFPGFHIRNMIGNKFNSMLKIGTDALNPKLSKLTSEIVLGKNLDKTITTKTGKVLTYGQIRDMIKKESNILTEGGVFGNIEQGIEQQAKDIAKSPLKRAVTKTLNPFSRENIALKTGQNIGQFIENDAKVRIIVSSLLEGNDIKKAVQTTNEALFDYSKLTPFERRIMRRLMPFYTFARKNFELQLRTLAENPGAIATQLKGVKAVGETVGEPVTPEDEAGLPPWVLNSLGIKAGVNQYGQNRYITGFGLPLEEFLGRFSGENSILWNSMKNTLTQFNPLIKAPLEVTFDRDLFRNKPIQEITDAQDVAAILSLFGGLDSTVSKQLQDLIEFRKISAPVFANGVQVGTRDKYVANPHFLHLFRNLPTARITATAGRFSDPTQTMEDNLLSFLTGVKAYSIDQETQRFFNELNEKQELQRFLVQLGIVKEFKSVYKPKD